MARNPAKSPGFCLTRLRPEPAAAVQSDRRLRLACPPVRDRTSTGRSLAKVNWSECPQRQPPREQPRPSRERSGRNRRACSVLPLHPGFATVLSRRKAGERAPTPCRSYRSPDAVLRQARTRPTSPATHNPAGRLQRSSARPAARANAARSLRPKQAVCRP